MILRKALALKSALAFIRQVMREYAESGKIGPATRARHFLRETLRRDTNQFVISNIQLDALRRNIPASIDELTVKRYHSIVDLLETSSGEDLFLCNGNLENPYGGVAEWPIVAVLKN